MEQIQKLLEELNYYWYYFGDDPYDKGMHSKCIKIQEKLIEIFLGLNDEEILEFCKSIPKDKLEQLAYPLEEVSIAHPCVNPYVKY